jgi:hypothetical protein
MYTEQFINKTHKNIHFLTYTMKGKWISDISFYMYSNAPHEINLCDSVMMWCVNIVVIFHKILKLCDSVTLYSIDIIVTLHLNLNYDSLMFCSALYTSHWKETDFFTFHSNLRVKYIDWRSGTSSRMWNLRLLWQWLFRLWSFELWHCSSTFRVDFYYPADRGSRFLWNVSNL